MKIDKPILKKVNSGLKIATTIMASSAIVFGVTTSFLSLHPKLIENKKNNIISNYQHSEEYLTFKKYEEDKFLKQLEDSQITSSEFEEHIEKLANKESVLNHFRTNASKSLTQEYEQLEKSKEEADDLVNRGFCASICSLGGTIGLAFLSSHLDEKLRSQDLKISTGDKQDDEHTM